MLTREQLLDYIDKNYNFHLMEYQKTALWEFYKIAANCDGKITVLLPMRNSKLFTYKIMKELWEYEHRRNNEIDK